jgi:predicted Zn-dependent protease
MKDTVKELLNNLNGFAKDNGITAEFWLHIEQSRLMRFANSAISLNTREDTMNLTIVAYRDNAKGSFTLVTNLDQVDAMKQAILSADDIARHAAKSSYPLTMAQLTPQDDDDRFFNGDLLNISPADKLAYINQAVQGLESDDVTLSGMFSSGALWQATTNTLSDTVLFHATTDAHISLVLSHITEKWEIFSSQSAAAADDLDPSVVHKELALLLNHFKQDTPFEAETGSYDVVFGREALSSLVGACNWIGFNGGGCRRNMTFLKDDDIGKKIFSDKLSLSDDPTLRQTFPYAFDCNGLPRKLFPFIENGVFKSFFWDRDSSDEFGETETSHTVPSMSMSVLPGDAPVNSLADVLAMPRDKDILYFPYLHYMNVVNATKSIVTGCSRFGALMLKKDGTVQIPYNVRMTDSILNLFNNIDWLSSERVAINTSGTYGERNPSAMLIPHFVKINDVSITRSNHSF